MKLIITLNVLLAIAVAWSWSQRNDAEKQLTDAHQRLDNCSKYTTAIRACKLQSQDIRIAAADYDCSKDILTLIRNAGIESPPNIKTGPIQVIQDEVAITSINNPISQPATLQQLVKMLSAAQDNAVRFLVDSIELHSDGEPVTGQPEVWNVVDLDLRYFSLIER